MDDFVDDEDATQKLVGGERTLRQLLSHQGAFRLDSGAYLFCYPYGLTAFWPEPDDLVSPHYDSAVYGNLGGGFEYSAFNYSLAGAYLVNRTAVTLPPTPPVAGSSTSAGMCTAMLDGYRATSSPIGSGRGGLAGFRSCTSARTSISISPTDELCEDNFYSSEDLYGDPYSWQLYHLDEAAAEPRDPAGGVIALGDRHGALRRGVAGQLPRYGRFDLSGWRSESSGKRRSNLGCHPNCPYERYYGIGFFTDTLPGASRCNQVGHGGSRAGYASAFVLRPRSQSRGVHTRERRREHGGHVRPGQDHSGRLREPPRWRPTSILTATSTAMTG